MTTETISPTRMQVREERFFDHLREQFEVAAKMGGNVQLIVDLKLCEGRMVGEASIDLKHRFDLQAK